MKQAAAPAGFDDLRDMMLRRLHRMLELNADIDRNGSDAVFVQEGGQIEYIFDENVFEMFVHPLDRADYVSAFFSRPRENKKPHPGQLINAQSAMIASEHLLGGALPGQQDRPILMTEWHYWELYEQVRSRTSPVRERAESTPVETEIKEFFDRLAALEEKTGGEAMELSALLPLADETVRRDSAMLLREGWPEAVLCRFVIAREAARLLAEDRVMEPLQQLERIFSDEIAPRLRPLHLDYRLPSQARAGVADETKEWMRRLVAEQKRRSDRYPEGKGRQHGSLQNDARALAFILWVAREFGAPNKRFVFVTGDSLTFDAYRRWHAEEGQSAPFVLRRPLQYAPILNFNDGPSDVSNSRVLFDRTRGAVEVSMIIFNLGMRPEVATEQDQRPLHFAGQREKFLLQLADPEAIHHPSIMFFLRQPESWWRDRVAALDGLRDEWQRFERVAIGANYELVSRRLDLAQRKKTEVIAELGAEASGSVIANYTQRLLDRIMQNSVRVWFPLAAEFIRSGREEAAGRTSAGRVPISLRLNLQPAGRAEPASLNQLLDAWERNDPWAQAALDPSRNSWLEQRQHLVFAIAAGIALRLALWSQAERYADLAVAAALTADKVGQDVEEYRYLRALATRFRIGSFSPYGTDVTEDVWGKWAKRAEAGLTECEAFHHEPAVDAPRQILRELRAVSERAALALFYASWVAAVGGRRLPRVMTPEEGFHKLQGAVEDLRRCLKIVGEFDPAALDPERSAFFGRIRKQFLVNIAAACVLSALFSQRYAMESAACTLVDDPALLAQIKDLLSETTEPLPLAAQVDVQAFLALRYGDHAARDWLAGLPVSSLPSPILPIDREVMSAAKSLVS